MPSMPSVVTRWCPLLQLLHRNPQLREISLREDHPFGGCRQAPAMDTATLNPQGEVGRGETSMLPSCTPHLSQSTDSPAHGPGVMPRLFSASAQAKTPPLLTGKLFRWEMNHSQFHQFTKPRRPPPLPQAPLPSRQPPPLPHPPP